MAAPPPATATATATHTAGNNISCGRGLNPQASDYIPRYYYPCQYFPTNPIYPYQYYQPQPYFHAFAPLPPVAPHHAAAHRVTITPGGYNSSRRHAPPRFLRALEHETRRPGRGGRSRRSQTPRRSAFRGRIEESVISNASPGVRNDGGGILRVVRARTEGQPVGRRGQKRPIMPLKPGGSETTVMIRNVPNKYNRELLIKFLDRHCYKMNRMVEKSGLNEERSAYDFVYLPLDLRSELNLGYAFVNFTCPAAAWRFFSASNYQAWDLFKSNKVREVVSAKFQGKEELVQHFSRTRFECKSKDFLPVLFTPPRDGSNDPEPQTIGIFAPMHRDSTPPAIRWLEPDSSNNE